MMVAKATTDLWQMAFGRPELDPFDLATAVDELASRDELDDRSRLLVGTASTPSAATGRILKLSNGCRAAPSRIASGNSAKSRLKRLAFLLGAADYR